MSDLNDPRVLFSAERTLLAWTRTSLTLMGFGFLIERFGLFLHMMNNQTTGVSRDLSFWVGISQHKRKPASIHEFCVVHEGCVKIRHTKPDCFEVKFFIGRTYANMNI